MQISEEALAWHREEVEGRRRYQWTLRQADVDLPDFQQYLEKNMRLKPNTLAAHLLRVNYFLGLFDLPSVDSDGIIGCLAHLYSSGLSTAVISLSILDPSSSTTRNIIVAVGHLCNYALMICGQKRYQEAHRCVSQLKEIFGP